MLAISRMETGPAAVKQEQVDLAALMEGQLTLNRELLEQRGQRLASALTPGVTITGDAALLGRAVGNLLSNASLYSPEGAEIRVWCGFRTASRTGGGEHRGPYSGRRPCPAFLRRSTGAEGSRSRATGGSGLGLYLVKMILDRHGAVCKIENTEDGVRAAVRFPASLQPVDFADRL